MSRESYQRRIDKLNAEFGPIICNALQAADIVEIMVNASGAIWVERLGGAMAVEGQLAADQVERIIGNVAHCCNTTVDRSRPIVSGELPGCGSRFEGLIPPVVSRPIFTIRRKASQLFTLEDYVTQGVMSRADALLVRTAVAERRNILIVGGTGSGKTTLVNAVLHEVTTVHPHHRIHIIEDTIEIQCAAKNVVQLRTSDSIDMTRLLKSTLRQRPDRIIVGEVRDGAALALLKAWNTGHPGGLATVHANSAAAGLTRLEQLIGEVTSSPMGRLIADAIDLVVSIERRGDRRVISDIIEVTGFEAGDYRTRSARPSHQHQGVTSCSVDG